MSASPAPANSDFTERLARIRERQSQSAVVIAPSDQLALQRDQMKQKATYAGAGLGIMAALLLGFYILGQSGEPAAAACAPVEAAAKPTVMKLNTPKTSGRKAVTPEVPVTPTPDCNS